MPDLLGIDEEHAEIYRLLLEAPSVDTSDVARDSGRPIANVERIVRDLETAGLVARQASAPHRVVASPPALALRPRLVEGEQRLAAAQEALLEYAEIYRRGADLRAAPDVVDVVLGADAVRQRIAQVQASAQERVDVFVKSDVTLVEAADNVEEERALARGVSYRVLVESGVVERPGFLEAVRDSAEAGEEVRAHPALPTRLFVVDGRLALLPMHSLRPEQDGGALLVHPSGLLDLVVDVFEEYWSSGRRLFGGDEDAASDRDLLSLLLLGLTDTAAGAQLGISPRTVQRRISELSERAGVSTRFQLGVEASRRGWV